MAVRIRGVPSDLPDGVYRVRIGRVRNAKGFSVMEGELLEKPTPKPKVRFVDNEFGVDIYKVVPGGEVRILNIPKEEISRVHMIDEFLELLGIQVLKG